ncbi:MAG: hypothetical protein JOZ69_17405 [Myxococcales bacterium]|nr:hypothetical protein [Myxococcales bacterium]
MAIRRLAVLLVVLSSCAFWREQLDVASVSGCVKKNCTDLDATAYTKCDAACRATYGR